jgi:sRNA-binding protein
MAQREGIDQGREESFSTNRRECMTSKQKTAADKPKIEKKIPMPTDDKIYTPQRGRHSRVVEWDKMDVGDSVKIPDGKFKVFSVSALRYAKQTKKEFIFLQDGTRVWRKK